MDAFLKEQKETAQSQNNGQHMQSLTAARPAGVNNSPFTPLQAIARAPDRTTQCSPNPLNSGISPQPTTGYGNNTLENTPRRSSYSTPQSNTRSRHALNSARSVSLGRLVPPPSTASYVSEPMANTTYQRNQGGNNLNLTPSNSHPGSITPQYRYNEPVDPYDDLDDDVYDYDDEEPEYFDTVSSHIATASSPQPCYDDSDYDVNHNFEASAQNKPEANERRTGRYIPAGGVRLLPPLSAQNTPLRRIAPNTKPKPQR